MDIVKTLAAEHGGAPPTEDDDSEAGWEPVKPKEMPDKRDPGQRGQKRLISSVNADNSSEGPH